MGFRVFRECLDLQVSGLSCGQLNLLIVGPLCRVQMGIRDGNRARINVSSMHGSNRSL